MYCSRAWSKSFPDDLKLMPSAFTADPPIGDRDASKGKGLSLPSQEGCQPDSFKPLLIISVFLSYFIQNKKMAHPHTLGHRKDLISCPRDLITEIVIGDPRNGSQGPHHASLKYRVLPATPKIVWVAKYPVPG